MEGQENKRHIVGFERKGFLPAFCDNVWEILGSSMRCYEMRCCYETIAAMRNAARNCPLENQQKLVKFGKLRAKI